MATLRMRGTITNSTVRLFSSSNSRPQIQVPSHVAVFTLLSVPVVLFTLYADRYGSTEESLEEELHERYEKEVQRSTSHNDQMAQFFQQTFKKPTEESDKAIGALLRGGKSDKKRPQTIDKKDHEAAEDLVEPETLQEVSEEQQEKKLKKKKKKRKKVKSPTDATIDKISSAQQNQPQTATEKYPIAPSAAVTVAAAVATVAGIAGYLFGGRRSS